VKKGKRPLSGVRNALLSLAELVTKDFWLKVLSLAIAMVVYIVLQPEAEEKPILPYVGMNIEKPWSAPAHSVVIDTEPATSKPAQTAIANTNTLQRTESESKGTRQKNGGKRD